MTIETAIKLAIEGGYTNAMGGAGILNSFDPHTIKETTLSYYLLDPQFWQALGKSCGWGTIYTLVDEGNRKEWDYYYHCPVCGSVIADEEDGCPKECDTDNGYVSSWVYEWKKLIQHLADNGTIESYFASLPPRINY